MLEKIEKEARRSKTKRTLFLVANSLKIYDIILFQKKHRGVNFPSNLFSLRISRAYGARELGNLHVRRAQIIEIA
jgi:hypothetical protein